MKCMKYIIKPATPTNIPDILRIQELCGEAELKRYGADLCESYEVFHKIISNSANLSFLIYKHESHHICGYLIAHLWNCLDKPPRLHSHLESDLGKPECCFIHDLAIEPAYQCCGFGKQLIDNLENYIKPMDLPITLVAVNGANKYWSNRGFSEIACCDLVKQSESADILESYKAESAIFMMRCKNV